MSAASGPRSGPSSRRAPAGGRAGGKGRGAGSATRSTGVPAGVAARRLAIDALVRIERDGAYANLVLPHLLERSDLDERDRRFATELVYGATRMRRTCDWLVDRFVLTDLDPVARAVLRVGAYQLAFLDTPAHAAVSATVEAAPRKLRGLANAVLRKVASSSDPAAAPTPGIALSYPDWIVERLGDELGPDEAVAALAAMNRAATVTERPDGYIQDRGSQWVADAVEARAGERILDLCAAPGGKATALASVGARVVAADVRPSRAGLIRANAAGLGLDEAVDVVVADGVHPPFPSGSFDRVLIDAPCSGLGSLRRRPDARWRIVPADVDDLATLQRRLVEAAVDLLRPGGVLVYSVCTLTSAETEAVAGHLAAVRPELEQLAPPGVPWRPAGRGALLLPQDADTDGMYLFRVRRPG